MPRTTARPRSRVRRAPCKGCGGAKGPGRGRDYCESCAVGVPADAANQAAYKRAWQEHNAERVAADRKQRYEAAKAEIRAFKEQGCVDCGEDDVRVIQVDHVKGEKLLNTSQLITAGKERRQEELSRCVPRCANCHVRRHVEAGTFA